VELRFHSLHLPAQLRHALAQLRQAYETFLIGVDQTLDAFSQPRLFAP
jgi:hypothetical protein